MSVAGNGETSGDDRVEPFFYARRIQDRIETKGNPHCFLGHELEGSDGIFASWDWDGKSLRVRNDRYGFFPLYYFLTPSEIGVSPSILQLLSLGAPLDLDNDALAVFLRMGFMLAEDTPFKAVRALPPRADFTWGEGVSRLEGGLWTTKREELGGDAALDGFISLFRAAIRKRPPKQGEFGMALTGGRDSRHILLELCEQGYRPSFCLTMKHFPPRPNEDSSVAAMVASSLGLNHISLEQPGTRFETELRKNLLTEFCTDEHQWALAMADYLKGKTSCLYDGIAGDILTSGVFQTSEHLVLFSSGNYEALARVLLPRTEPLLHLLRSHRYEEVHREIAVQKLSIELKRHSDAPNPIGSFFFWNRTRREIALIPYRILRGFATVYSPFLDHALYDFLSSLPGEFVVGGDFHSAAIMRGYPKFADLRFERKESPLRPDFAFFRHFAYQTLLYNLERGSQTIRRRYLLPRLTRCLIDRGYSPSVNWLAPLSIYLMQLERLTDNDLGLRPQE